MSFLTSEFGIGVGGGGGGKEEGGNENGDEIGAIRDDPSLGVDTDWGGERSERSKGRSLANFSHICSGSELMVSRVDEGGLPRFGRVNIGNSILQTSECDRERNKATISKVVFWGLSGVYVNDKRWGVRCACKLKSII